MTVTFNLNLTPKCNYCDLNFKDAHVMLSKSNFTLTKESISL